MKRRLFNLAAGVSLVLCVTVTGICLFSLILGERVAWHGLIRWGGSVRAVDISLAVRGACIQWRDEVAVWAAGQDPAGMAAWADGLHVGWWDEYVHSGGVGPMPSPWSSFAWEHSTRTLPLKASAATARDSQRDLVFPGWLLVLALIILPALWTRTNRLERRRDRRGLCSACGYDLRGSPAGGTCPECGAARPAISN